MTPKLSVIIITRNEEQDLPACLESVQGLDAEIIVLDGGSTDRTVEIARGVTPHVFHHPFSDYSSQKQAALDRATGQWVFSIDADERLTSLLRDEIRSLVDKASDGGNAVAYEIPFQVYFLGRRLRFGGLGSEHHVRLFRRDAGSFKGKIHEGISVQGSIGHLTEPIEHIPYRDIGEYLRKLDAYTTSAAQKRWAEGRRFTWLYHLLPFWEFFARVVIKRGFLDGTPGIVWAGLASFHTWVKYVKLWERARENNV